MQIIKLILLAIVGYAIYETGNHFLGELDKKAEDRPSNSKRRVTGHGDWQRSRTDSAGGQSSSTVVGRGVVSRNA